MTHHPDDHQPPEDPRGRGEGSSPRLDEDAVWREIVANYGERPVVEDPERPEPGPEPAPRATFDRRYLDSLDTEATWEDEGHFVPPDPPPAPPMPLPRRLAWIGLFGAPLVLLAGVLLRMVLDVSYPAWPGAVLIAAFLGGFGYLVATMPRSRDDDWGGDDGAVV